MLFYLIPVDALFIIRPIFTILLSVIFLLVLKFIKYEKSNNRKTFTNVIYLFLNMLLFVLIGEFATLAIYKSLIIGVLLSILFIFTINFGNRYIKVISLIIVGLFLFEYVEPIQKNTSSNLRHKFFTFGFADDYTTYNASKDYMGKKSISKIYDELYWGYNKNFPIRGRVFYPDTDGNFPLIFILHGNFLAEFDSHKGYDYILKHLASKGYIGVSVDQNFLNGDWTNLGLGQPWENDVRAKHLLATINYFKTLNSNQNSPLFNKINIEKINIIGHSRGGEAVAIASTISNDIKKIVALAPSWNQYKGEVNISNNPYLVIQGADDGDLKQFQGINTYNKITNNIQPKAAILIDGFNHVQFNSDWGRYDGKGPGKIYFTKKDLKDAKIQRDFTKNIIIDFFEHDSFNSVLSNLESRYGIRVSYNYRDYSFKPLLDMDNIEEVSEIIQNNLKTSYIYNNSNNSLKIDWNKKDAYLQYFTKDTLEIEDLILQVHNDNSTNKSIKITLYPSKAEKTIILNDKIDFKYYRHKILHNNINNNLMFQTYKIPVNQDVNGLKIEFNNIDGTVYLDDIMFTSHQKKE